MNQYENIIKYQFESLYSMTKSFMFCDNEAIEDNRFNSGEPAFMESNNLFDDYENAVGEFDRLASGIVQSRHWIEIYVYKIVINMMKIASIPYTEIYDENRNEKNSVIYKHGSKQIQGYFLYDITDDEAYRTPSDKIAEELRKTVNGVNKVKVYVFRDSVEFPSLASLVNSSDGNEDHFVEVSSIKEFFLDLFSEDIYCTFIDYVRQYCEKARKLIAFRTVVMPTESALSAFRERKRRMLDCYDYERIMHSGNVGSLNQKEFKAVKDNCINNNMFSAMTGKNSFAESFISAEWFYDVYSNAMGDLEKTGIIAGYLKSIEQLLSAIVGFHKDQGFKILNKSRRLQPYTSSNEENINSTLGSLKEFVVNAKLPVSANIRGCLTVTLENWKNYERNGYFHKDNLFCLQKMDEVRESTFFLYFIILGGLKYSVDEMFALGVHLNSKVIGNLLNDGINKQQFASWLEKALVYDTDENTPFYYFSIHDCDGHASIYVHRIAPFSFEDYESGQITLKTIRRSFDYNHVKKWPTLSWERNMDEKGNLLGQILDCVNSFSEENPDLINKVGGIVGSYEGQVMLLHKKKGS